MRQICTIPVICLLAIAGCASFAMLSKYEHAHLNSLLEGREVWVKQSFIPQNQYAVKLNEKAVEVGDRARIVAIEITMDEVLIKLRYDTGKTFYFVSSGESVVAVEQDIAEYFAFKPLGEDNGTSKFLENGLHIHSKDHVQVLLPRTPLLIDADFNSNPKSALAAGDRVSIMDTRKENSTDWLQVKDIQTKNTGWILQDWVTPPVFVYEKEDIELHEYLTNRSRTVEAYLKALKVAGVDKNTYDNKGKTGWPMSLTDIVRTGGLSVDMNSSEVILLLGPPDSKTTMLQPISPAEALLLDVWVYGSGVDSLKVRIRKSKVVGWDYNGTE